MYPSITDFARKIEIELLTYMIEKLIQWKVKFKEGEVISSWSACALSDSKPATAPSVDPLETERSLVIPETSPTATPRWSLQHQNSPPRIMMPIKRKPLCYPRTPNRSL